MGTVGPGSVHLLNGLYDAAKSRTPILAICGQVPLAEVGTDYFQEVDNDLLFRDVAVYRATVSSPTRCHGCSSPPCVQPSAKAEWRCSPCPGTWVTGS